jgi:hypothetical protein
MYLAKQLTLRSLPEIGRQFGGRDHTTVLRDFARSLSRFRGCRSLASFVSFTLNAIRDASRSSRALVPLRLGWVGPLLD